MLEMPDVMAMAAAMSAHAARRQSVIAANVANADTPGYLAKDIAGFPEAYRALMRGDIRATRPGHLSAGTAGGSPAEEANARTAQRLSPNGNGVSLEREMIAAAEVRREHGQALAIYKSSLDILRSSLGRR